ncbi:MAG: glycoside hydrolase family 130 protein [Chloroflexota bacterium]
MTISDRAAGEGSASFADPTPIPYQLERLGVVMRPHPDDPDEAGGVLNPGGVRAPNGDFLLFPRLVALGNYSRIGVARVVYDSERVPYGVERLGIALEPTEPYERNDWTGGGCEDARVNYVEALGVYVMTYAAFGPNGPHCAMAVSRDLASWTRLGLIDFAPILGTDMNIYSNKDHMLFPDVVEGPDGQPSIALLHRPMYEIWEGDLATHNKPVLCPSNVTDPRWAIWISYCPLADADWANPGHGTPLRAPTFSHHHILAAPRDHWESVRIGAGTPPIQLNGSWFTIYHGVEAIPGHGLLPAYRYSAGALVLDLQDPREIIHRSVTPILEPGTPEEVYGVVANVVFPTAVDQHDTYLDVYYGMADDYIGAARMTIG